MVEEERKGVTAAVDSGVAEADEQFFINEDQFENVVPEFGTCGAAYQGLMDKSSYPSLPK